MSDGLWALKTIRHIHDIECGEDESINKDFDIIEKELKDRDNALKTISDIIRDFNRVEFLSAEIALQEITDILKKVL